MNTTTIRIDKSTHNLLKEIAIKSHKTLNNIIVEMSIDYQQKVFWNDVNKSYKKLKSNKISWNEELEERDIWAQSTGDGIE